MFILTPMTCRLVEMRGKSSRTGTTNPLATCHVLSVGVNEDRPVSMKASSRTTYCTVLKSDKGKAVLSFEPI